MESGLIDLLFVKVLTTFDKDIIFQNAAKPRSYNESRDSPVYTTDHLPKLFYNQKNRCDHNFSLQKKEGKKTKWAAYDGKYAYTSITNALNPPCSLEVSCLLI